jgi:hypothetical protein
MDDGPEALTGSPSRAGYSLIRCVQRGTRSRCESGPEVKVAQVSAGVLWKIFGWFFRSSVF